ncbi:MAG: HD domain-containing protein [Candidatus Latescibacteria bacterium]|nr:HD domain-containing protein [Candidatus Latescibacterota bacterium]
MERLAAQVGFILEVDKLKQILRQTLVSGGQGRRENDAEHSWHLGLMALTLREYAAEPVELLRVVEMLLIHDLVEIDAGDTFVYDEAAQASKAEREERAAVRIFGLLPADQAARVRGLWEEFEARQTPEARYAAALDRYQPLLLNFATEGAAWRRHGVRRAQVIERNRHIEEGAPVLWAAASELIEEAVRRGWILP